MLLSRAVPILRQSVFNHTARKCNGQLISVRNGGGGEFVYRNRPKEYPLFENLATLGGAFVWWWVFWNLFTEYEHIIGEFPYPDASQWTDEELGVPPDDYEPRTN